MDKTIALLLGVLAWVAVGAIAVSAVNAWRGDNQVLAFLPILAAVVVAWGIGEVVTERVFAAGEEK